MSRKLILTPYDHGYFAGASESLNEVKLKNHKQINVGDILLSSVTMAGVDSIHSLHKSNNSESKFITKKLPDASSINWVKCIDEIDKILEKYSHPSDSAETQTAISGLSRRIATLLFAMQGNYSILLLGKFISPQDKGLLPAELLFPVEVLLASLQTKNINLPVIRQDIEKKEIRKLVNLLDTKEYRTFQEAQTEIELNKTFTSRTAASIEKAGKEFYKKNSGVINLRENIITALPISTKLIDLFFGKLPGILTESVSNIIGDYLKINKTVPIYNCDNLLRDLAVFRASEILAERKE